MRTRDRDDRQQSGAAASVETRKLGRAGWGNCAHALIGTGPSLSPRGRIEAWPRPCLTRLTTERGTSTSPAEPAHAGRGLMGLMLAHSWWASASRWMVRRCPPRRREPGDAARASGPAPAPTPADPRPPRRTACRALPPDPSLDQPCRPTLVMSCCARTRHTYDGTRRDGRMT